MHCQIVVIPGLTDGKNLTKTITDLGRLHPAVASIGVVPVGKTKYARNVRVLSRDESRSVIRTVRTLHRDFRRKTGRGLVYLADEFFIKAGLTVPPREYYDDLPQYENGIGMARCLLDEIERVRSVRRTKGRYLMLTGASAQPFLRRLKLRLAPEIDIDVKAVANGFFGRSVTVSGLLCGQDLDRAITEQGRPYDLVILPPECVNENKEFLDGRRITDRRAVIAPETVRELIRCLQ
jgi:NifB/MoaA-like Fe-S oxidoreductase